MKRITLIALGITAVAVVLVAGVARRAPSRERVTVTPELAGKVKAVRVQEGQAVRQGQILAILDNDAEAAACAAAVARMKQKEAEYQAARNEVDQAYAAWYKTFVRAPVAGVIAKRHLSAGETSTRETPVVTIAAQQ